MHTLDLEELLHLILAGVTKTLGFDRARLYLYNEEQKLLELKMAVGMKKEEIKNIAVPVMKDPSIIALTLLEQKPFVVADAQKEPRAHKGLVRLFNIKAFAAVPLLARGKAKGVISADYLYSRQEISPEKVEALTMFAHEAGLALDNAEMFQRLQNTNFALADQVHSASKNLHKTMQYLERSEKLAAMGQLAAGIAHEIRNPLTSIKILVHSLSQNGQADDQRKQDIEVISHEIERLEKLVREFLDFGRLPEPKLEELKISDVINNTHLLLQHEFKKRQIRFESDFPEEGARVVADREQLGQVFFNLIQNAMEAIGKKGKISAVVRNHSNTVQVRLEDNGPGIAKEIRERLFEPFTTTKEEGTGLGLSIVYRIVDSFGGTIQVESEPGQGASFIVTLPAPPPERNPKT